MTLAQILALPATANPRLIRASDTGALYEIAANALGSTAAVSITNITGNAATVTTNANLTGPITSTGNGTAIADGAIGQVKITNLVTDLATKAPSREIKTTGFTAVVGGRYMLNNAGAVVSIVDPTGTSGQSYSVIVGTGTFQFNGTGTTYSPSRFQIMRYHNGTSWTTISNQMTDTLTVGSGTWSGSTFTGAQSFSSSISVTGSVTATSFTSTGALALNSVSNGNITLTPNGTGFLDIVKTSQSGIRENILRAKVSDATDDAFHVFNSTSVDGVFQSGFSGSRFTNSSGPAIQFVANTSAGNDTGTQPMMAFESRRTSSTTDPNNGTLGAITARPLFRFGTSGASFSHLLILANGTNEFPTAVTSTNTTSGTIVCAGGAGIAGALNVGGQTELSGSQALTTANSAVTRSLGDARFAPVREIKTTGFTAVLGGRYTLSNTGGVVSVVDPTGTTAGQSYVVTVGQGSMQFNGTGTTYVPSRVEIKRYYNGTSWITLTPQLSDQLELNNQALTTSNSAMTRGLADTRYAPLFKVKSNHRQETIILLGDSYTSRNSDKTNLASFGSTVPTPNNTGYLGYFTWANIYLNARFKVISDLGVSGDTLTGMATRYSSGFTNSVDYTTPTVIPSVTSQAPDWLFLFGGINDISGGASGATVFSRWQTIYNLAKADGIKIATANIPGLTSYTASQLREAAAFNNLLALFCYQNGVPMADFHTVTTDPATDVFPAAYTNDNTHLTLVGTQKAGKELARVLGTNPLPSYSRLPGTRSLRHVNVNYRLVGSNAANTNGWRNFVNLSNANGPSGTTVESAGTINTSTITISKVARPDGIPGEITRCVWTADPTSVTSARLQLSQEVREVAWSSAGTPSPSSASAGGHFSARIVTSTGRAAGTPVDYMVTNWGGAFAAGSDPTAGWSTVIGTIITDGGVTMRVVPAVIPGTTVLSTRCVFSGVTLTGGTLHQHTQLHFLNSSGTGVGELNSNRWDAGSTKSAEVIASGIMESPAVLVPATTARYQLRYTIWFDAASNGQFDIETMEILIPEVTSIP